MKNRIRALDSDQKMILTEGLARLPEDLPVSRDICRRALELAYSDSSLDLRAIISRFFWLTSPGKTEHYSIGLGEKLPSLSAEELAETIIFPRETVFEIVHRKTGLDRDFLRRLYEQLASKGNPCDYEQIADLAEERILQEITWWLTDLRFPQYYLRNTPPELMARQIMLNRSYELAGIDSKTYEHMRISATSPEGTSTHWVHRQRSLEVEEEIEREYYEKEGLYTITAFSPLKNLVLYLVYRNAASGEEGDFKSLTSPSFFNITDTAAQERYRRIWRKVRESGDIEIEKSRKEETGENRLTLGFPRGKLRHFLTTLSRVMARNDVEITRKYTVTTGGGRPTILVSLYSRQDFPEDSLRQLLETNLCPRGAMSELVESGTLTTEEANFLNAAVHFVHKFITALDPNLGLLTERFKTDKELTTILVSIQSRIDRDRFLLSQIAEVFSRCPDLVCSLFKLFTLRLDPKGRGDAKAEQGAQIRLATAINSMRMHGDDLKIVRCAVRFTEAIKMTNFFLSEKSAISFRIGNDFFEQLGLKPLPFSVFFVVGYDFQGFHIRFTNIARGGIRLLRSGSYDEYRRNSDSLFEECYNLAYTQNKKNKDIPEGGAKGIILPSLGATQAETEQCFRHFVDALLDLMLPCNEAMITDWVENTLFLGPDEGTAHLMDWASSRALERGYRYWRAFTTGKDASNGGISHKDYGMTSQGIRRYVLGILQKAGIEESTITKVQTGGPDGDLGANEILLSKDKTIAVIDGEGVLYDPAGLDRQELARLARIGTASADFDPAKLGPEGFKVSVEDTDIKLPDGSTVVSGLAFRNTFHLDPRVAADLFVPCGGRPQSINLSNWASLLDERGKPVFRWLVEGANLFITQDARLRLEHSGLILFKDSSTNKGGVISSALEVLAALGLTDEEYDGLMTVKSDGKIPEFRSLYIAETIEAIRRSADMEFELLWSSHEHSGIPLSQLSETVSEKINAITKDIEESPLFEQETIRRQALRLYTPGVLLNKVPVTTLMQRLPRSYEKAMFSRTLASRFVYRFGLDAGFEDYRQFIDTLTRPGETYQ